MPDIRLQDYCDGIAGLINGGQYKAAIAHCQHILGHYPDHVETSSLLGRAYLGSGMLREATEMLERALAADPENVAAHRGLAEILALQGSVTEAIQQLGWAYELAPGEVQVRDMLQRLNAQRAGPKQATLRLSRGALGALYARNGLWEKAIGELRVLLAQDSQRPHTGVALAEALWHTGKRAEAVETCLRIIETNPACLKANLILGEIWLQSGHQEAGQDRLERVRALDPENLVAQQLMGQHSPLRPETVLIPSLDPDDDTVASPPASSDEPDLSMLPDWLQELENGESPSPTQASDAPSRPDLAGMEIPGDHPPPLARTERGKHAAAEPQHGDLEEVPEWLLALDASLRGPEAADGTEDPSLLASKSEDRLPDWLVQLAPAHTATDDLPWWLEPDLEEAGEEGAPRPVSAAATPALPEDERDRSGPPGSKAEEESSSRPPDDGRPEWVREMEAIAGVMPRQAIEEPSSEVPSSRGPGVDTSIAAASDAVTEPLALVELARSMQEAGDWTGALDCYSTLVARKQAGPRVIGHLEELLHSEAEQARVCELLGDAHRQEGKLDEALKMYRRARQAIIDRQSQKP